MDRLIDAFVSGPGRLVFEVIVGLTIATALALLMPRLARLLRYLPLGSRVRFRSEPIPDAWREIVRRNVPLAARLTAEETERLLRIAQVFVADKPIEGAAGLEITDEIRITIAAQASLLLLRMNYPVYPRLRRVLVYPGTFFPQRITNRHDLVTHEEIPALLGEAWQDGIVVLSWHSSHGASGGGNVVLHEFAHVLDQEDGAANGMPILDTSSAYHAWGYALGDHYREHQQKVEDGEDTLLGAYAATNRAEHFAVATEQFFERPAELKASAPALYDALKNFYRQDPAHVAPEPGMSED